MLYLDVTYIYKKLWIAKKKQTNLYYVGYQTDLIQEDVYTFSLYKNQILALKQKNKIFIYLLNLNCSETEDAFTLIKILDTNENFDIAIFWVDNVCYNIDKNCNIICVS